MRMETKVSGMICLAVFAAMSWAQYASGAMITVDYDAGDFPASADVLTVTDAEYVRDTRDGRLLAQTFTLPTGPESSFQLEEILLARTQQTDGVNYTLRLFAVEDVNADTLTPAGADLINEDLTTDGDFGDTLSTIKYTLSGDPLLLTPSVTVEGKTSGYAVMFDSANTSGWGIKWRRSGTAGAAYAGGTAYEAGSDQSRDHMLAVNGTYVVPEPATMSLLAIGGLAMLIRRRSV